MEKKRSSRRKKKLFITVYEYLGQLHGRLDDDVSHSAAIDHAISGYWSEDVNVLACVPIDGGEHHKKYETVLRALCELSVHEAGHPEYFSIWLEGVFQDLADDASARALAKCHPKAFEAGVIWERTRQQALRTVPKKPKKSPASAE